MAKIEWLKAAEEEAHISSREFGVREAADIVLLNVATHAAEARIRIFAPCRSSIVKKPIVSSTVIPFLGARPKINI